MDSLNGVQYLLRLIYRVKSLDMKNNAFAGACIDEKSGKPESFTEGQLGCLFSQRSESNRFDR